MNWIKSIALFFLCILVFGSSLCAQNADIDLLRQINLNRNRNLDPGFQLFSNSAAPLTIGIPLAMVAYQLVKKDSAGNKKALFICTSSAMAALISISLKYGIQRTRPFVTYPEIEKETVAGSLSFPSGHTSSSFALATSLSMAYPKWYVISASFLWAGTVAYSRMDLGAHYPTDVLAGALIGSGSAWLSYKFNDYLYHFPDRRKKYSNKSR